MTIHKILVPVDYSECSRAALELALEMARTDGAELDIVHVWDRPAYVNEAVMVRHEGGKPRSLIEMIHENAEHDMAEFLSRVQIPAGVRHQKRLLSGNPAATILKELERGAHELLVIGTHGRTGLPHILLGSVAEKMVRLSPVPVLTVPWRKRV
jgi:universal stress protein A